MSAYKYELSTCFVQNRIIFECDASLMFYNLYLKLSELFPTFSYKYVFKNEYKTYFIVKYLIFRIIMLGIISI